MKLSNQNFHRKQIKSIFTKYNQNHQHILNLDESLVNDLENIFNWK